jgi:chromosome segregation ATPase
MTTDQLDVIEARLERLTAVVERTADNVEAISEEVRSLTRQVGLLTTGLTEIRLTTERQEQNITRLVGIVETQIQQQS